MYKMRNLKPCCNRHIDWDKSMISRTCVLNIGHDNTKEKVADPFDEDLNAIGKYDNSYSPEESDDVVSEITGESDISVPADKNDEIAASPESETDFGDEVYEPIVLVPAGANPPVKATEKSEVAEK